MTSDTPDPNARLAEFLAIGDTKQDFPGVPVRDAATMLVIDRTGPVPKVLMGRRHDGHKFMPGKFVFPGGRVEVSDRRMPSATPLDPRVAARLTSRVRDPGELKSRGFALAAIREVFEETGLILGRRHAQSPEDAKRRLAPPSEDWVKFASTGVLPDLAAVHFIARAITPPGRPRRFDTRFFALDADAIVDRVDGIITPEAELVELVWLSIGETQKLDMPGITMAVVEELKLRTAAGFSHDLPVPFYRMLHGKRLREFLD